MHVFASRVVQIVGLAFIASFWVLGCQPRGCSGSSSPAGTASSCALVRVLGQAPTWGGPCESARTCRMMKKGQRMGWSRCVAGRCLLGSGDAKLGHIYGIHSMAVGDRHTLVSGDAGGDVRMWNAETGVLLGGWRAHRGVVRSLVVVNKHFLLSAGDDEVIRLWFLPQKQLVGLWKVRGRVSSLAVSPGGRWLAAASTDRAVWVRRLVLPRPGVIPSRQDKASSWARWMGHKDAVRSVDFSHDGKWLLSASDDRTALLWDVSKGKVAHVYKGHRSWVRRAVFPPTSSAWLVTAGFDMTILSWNREGKLLTRWGPLRDPLALINKSQASPPLPSPLYPNASHKEGHKSDISDLAVSPDGRLVASTGHRGVVVRLPDDGTTARIWKRADGLLLCHLKDHALGITRGRFLSGGKRFATASEDGTIRIYSVP